MNILATFLFPIGTVAIAIAFAAHVGHAVLLANGRRSIGLALPTARQPAWAGAVTGSFATAQSNVVPPDSPQAPLGIAPTPLGRAAVGIALIGFATLAGYLVARGLTVGRGPWGNLYEFSVAFALRDHGRLPVPAAAATRSRPIAFIPIGVAFFLLTYAFTLPSDISPLVPALQQPAADHDPRGHGDDQLRHLRDVVRRGRGLPGPGQGGPRHVAAASHKVLDEVAYKAVIIGFPIFATLIILGSYWASIAWGRYWGWDPKETVGPRHVADLRRLPARAQPARLGRPTRGPDPGRSASAR